MKKLLLLISLLASLNTFSDIILRGSGDNFNITGGGYSMVPARTYNLGSGTNTLIISGSAHDMAAGSKFIIPAGATFKVYDGDPAHGGSLVLSESGPKEIVTNTIAGSNTIHLSGTFLATPTGTPGSSAPGSGTPGSGAPGTATPPTIIVDGTEIVEEDKDDVIIDVVVLPGTGAPGTGAPGTGAPGTGAPGTGGAGIGNPKKVIKSFLPRSKVALDLTKVVSKSGFKNFEAIGNEGKTDLNIVLIRNFENFKDTYSVRKYDTESNGIGLFLTKNFNKFTLGGGFGYEKSKVKYEGIFEGIKENIDSYQFMTGGKYNFTDNVEVTGILTYSHNTHNFKAPERTVKEFSFNSNIIDFQTRLSSKYSEDIGYVKPYVGLGITRVEEGAIDKLGIYKTSGTSLNATLGVYGQFALGTAVDLFGNIEYEHKFNRKSYYRERNTKTGRKIEALEYDSGLNLGLGLRYKFSKFNLTTAYELLNDKNNTFKIGFSSEF